jgi:hypothetical protein
MEGRAKRDLQTQQDSKLETYISHKKQSVKP